MPCDELLKGAHIEPSFHLYHPDMVYSNPRIAEIDILLLLNGGYVCIELKEEPQSSPIDSLKFFQNGLGSQAVLYMSKKSLGHGEASNVAVLNPLIITREDFISEKLKEWVDNLPKFRKKRREFFSIDNFLCALLLYGSPGICNLLLPSKRESYKGPDLVVPFDRSEDLDDFIKYRISLIKLVKGLTRDTHEGRFNETAEGEVGDLKSKKLVILIPTLSPSFLKEVVRSIELIIEEMRSKTELEGLPEVVLLCTERSSDYCKKLQCKLGEGLSKIKSEVARLEEWSSKAVEEASGGGTILLIGEVPKRILIELVDKIYEKRDESIKLASLLWRPSHPENENDLKEFIKGNKYDFKSREEIELVLVEL